MLITLSVHFSVFVCQNQKGLFQTGRSIWVSVVLLFRTCTWMLVVWRCRISSGWRILTMSAMEDWPSSMRGTQTTTCSVSTRRLLCNSCTIYRQLKQAFRIQHEETRVFWYLVYLSHVLSYSVCAGESGEEVWQTGGTHSRRTHCWLPGQSRCE